MVAKACFEIPFRNADWFCNSAGVYGLSVRSGSKRLYSD